MKHLKFSMAAIIAVIIAIGGTAFTIKSNVKKDGLIILNIPTVAART